MLKAIVFDVFGVLAEDGWSPFKRQYISGRPELVKQVAALGKEVDQGKRSFDEMIRETAHLTHVNEAEVRAAVEHRVPNLALLNYIEKELKPHYKIGMLSNASYNVLDLLFTPEQVALFDATALSYEVGLVKPDKAMYEVLAKRLGVRLSEMLMVDDQSRHCAGALNTGMRAVLYENLPHLKTDLEPLLQDIIE
jgi:putative hydrolase of the HAD superfamily